MTPRRPSLAQGPTASDAAPSASGDAHELDAFPRAVLLRVYLGEDDRIDGVPAYEAIVRAARDAGLAGATVLRGSLGYGATTVVHRPSLWHLSRDLPLLVEMVDTHEQVEAFLPRLKELLRGGGLVTAETVWIVRHEASEGDGA